MPPVNPQTISGLSSVLREILLPRVRNQLNESVLFLNVFERETETIRQVGRDLKALMSVRTRHNQSIGNRVAGAALPAHGRAYYDQIEVQLGRVYGQISFDRAILIRPLKGQASVIADILDAEMESLTRTFHVDMSRQIQGDGSGAMCQITTAGGTGTQFTVDDSRYLEEGMIIDSWSAKTAGSQGLDSKTIKSIDKINHVVTMTASVTWIENHYLFREDNRGLEANGFLCLVDDGTVASTIQGQDRTASDLYNGNLKDAGTEPLSEDLLIETHDLGPIVSGFEADFIGSDYASRRYFAALMAAERRQLNTVKMKGGFKGLSFMAGGKEIGWFVDRHFYPNYVYFLTKRHFQFYESGPPEWVDEDGAVLSRISGYDEMEATLCHYWQLGCDRFNAQTRLYNYTDPNA